MYSVRTWMEEKSPKWLCIVYVFGLHTACVLASWYVCHILWYAVPCDFVRSASCEPLGPGQSSDYRSTERVYVWKIKKIEGGSETQLVLKVCSWLFCLFLLLLHVQMTHFYWPDCSWTSVSWARPARKKWTQSGKKEMGPWGSHSICQA